MTEKQSGTDFLLGQLSAQVGELNQRIADFNRTVTKLDERVGAHDRLADRMAADISYMKPHVSSWSRCKNRLAGAILVLPLAGGGIGIALDRIGAGLLRLLGDH